MTLGPNRSRLERIAGLQQQLHEIRALLADFRTGVEAQAEQTDDAHERRTWERIARHVGNMVTSATEYLPRWLPGLPRGCEKKGGSNDRV